MEVPAAVRELSERLEDAGFETWAVGGAVRDEILKRGGSSEDWDLATRARPEEMKRLFRRTVPLGPEYGTVGIFGRNGVLYEVTTFRRDITTCGRKATVAFSDSLEEDLARRDFTINAMAWHPILCELRDPHGGLRDLRAGVLRTVGSASQRFREDYLRVLRGLRFAGALRLEIDGDTWDGMVDAIFGLSHLSQERVREELMKVMGCARPSRALELYRSSGALQQLLPELGRPLGPEALAAVDAIGSSPDEDKSLQPILRMSVLLLFGLGRAASRVFVSTLLLRLRFSKAEVKRIAIAVDGGSGPHPDILDDPVERRRWMAGIGRDGLRDVFRIWAALGGSGASAEGGDDAGRVMKCVEDDLRAGVPLSLADLAVRGRDLLRLGWPPGPGIGIVLRRLLQAVWEDPSVNNRAALMDLATEMTMGSETMGSEGEVREGGGDDRKGAVVDRGPAG